MSRNTVRGLIRSEFVQCADFQASKLEHRVNHIGTSRHINGFPTEECRVEFLGGVGVACSKLDPAKRPGRVTCYFWHSLYSQCPTNFSLSLISQSVYSRSLDKLKFVGQRGLFNHIGRDFAPLRRSHAKSRQKN